jgi:hypothetical protein
MFDQAGSPEDHALATATLRAALRHYGVPYRVRVGIVFSGWQKDAIYKRWSGATYDYIGHDPYTKSSTNWTLPSQLWPTFYNRVAGGLLGPDGKYIEQIIGETGAISGPRRGPEWLPDMAVAAGNLPNLGAVWYWDDADKLNFTLDPSEYKYLRVAAKGMH